MDDARKHAYRSLLYYAMIDIRLLENVRYRRLRLLNPFILRYELHRASRAGAIADWLHNLAADSGNEFQGFREDWFWGAYERLVKRYPDVAWYRSQFDHELSK